MTTQTKILIGIGVAAILIGGYFFYKKNKNIGTEKPTEESSAPSGGGGGGMGMGAAPVVEEKPKTTRAATTLTNAEIVTAKQTARENLMASPNAGNLTTIAQKAIARGLKKTTVSELASVGGGLGGGLGAVPKTTTTTVPKTTATTATLSENAR